MNTTVSCELHLRLVVSSESSLPVPAGLRYDTADPYAVHATFHTGAEETVEWVFARDLLAEGLHRPTGTGDVRVWPSRSHGQGVVCIALSSPEGEALLEAPARALESFLKRTDAAVPPGTEHRHFDLDRSSRTSWRRAEPRPTRAARCRPLGETARAETAAYGTRRRRSAGSPRSRRRRASPHRRRVRGSVPGASGARSASRPWAAGRDVGTPLPIGQHRRASARPPGQGAKRADHPRHPVRARRRGGSGEHRAGGRRAPDGLPDVAALEDFVRQHDISDVGALSEFDLSAVRKVRGRFAEIFAAPRRHAPRPG